MCARWSRVGVYTHRGGMSSKRTRRPCREDTLIIYLPVQTLPSKRENTRADTHAPPVSRLDTDTSSEGDEFTSVGALLSVPAIRALTISGFALSFLSLAFDVVFTLSCYTPVDSGGLGLEVSVKSKSIGFAQGFMHLQTAFDDRNLARVRGCACRPPPAPRHAVHLAAFRLRQDVQCMHVHLAHRFWAPSIPQRPRPRLSILQFQLRIRTRLDRPSHPSRSLQNRGHTTQPQHAPHKTARSFALVAWSEQRARAVCHVRRACSGTRHGEYAVYVGERGGVGGAVEVRMVVGSGNSCGGCCGGEGDEGDRVRPAWDGRGLVKVTYFGSAVPQVRLVTFYILWPVRVMS